jgi:hypothetical protein
MTILRPIQLLATPSTVADDIVAGQAWRAPSIGEKQPEFAGNAAFRRSAETPTEGADKPEKTPMLDFAGRAGYTNNTLYLN